MIGFAIFLAGRVLAGEPGFDHIEDVGVVSRLLVEVEQGEVDLQGVEIINRDAPQENNAASFFAYARECSIKKISAVSSGSKRLPISSEWNCGRYIELDGKLVWEERSANFWVKEGEVIKIAFGKPMVLVIPTVRSGKVDQ